MLVGSFIPRIHHKNTEIKKLPHLELLKLYTFHIIRIKRNYNVFWWSMVLRTITGKNKSKRKIFFFFFLKGAYHSCNLLSLLLYISYQLLKTFNKRATVHAIWIISQNVSLVGHQRLKSLSYSSPMAVCIILNQCSVKVMKLEEYHI